MKIIKNMLKLMLSIINTNYLPIDALTKSGPPTIMPSSGWGTKASSLLKKIKERDELSKSNL